MARVPAFGISQYEMVEDQTASSYSVLSTITTYGSQVVKMSVLKRKFC